MTIEEIKEALVGKRLSVNGEFYSEGVVAGAKLVEFEGEECLFLYEEKRPDELWCWLPVKEVGELIKGVLVGGGQPDPALIDLIDW